jgi:hypothetical protein
MIFRMAEDAETKAKRRRRIRDSFPPPLNEIPLRHVDSVQALKESQRGILAAVLQKQGVQCLVDCLFALKSSGESIESEDDLIGRLELPSKLHGDIPAGISRTLESTPEDKDYLASLLTKCYPDMPESSAEALVASDVMSVSLCVVATTRQALEDAKSDFVVTALYTLFEERLHALREIISRNPAFVKAIQSSRPDWNITA